MVLILIASLYITNVTLHVTPFSLKNPIRTNCALKTSEIIVTKAILNKNDHVLLWKPEMLRPVLLFLWTPGDTWRFISLDDNNRNPRTVLCQILVKIRMKHLRNSIQLPFNSLGLNNPGQNTWIKVRKRTKIRED